jgi:transposase
MKKISISVQKEILFLSSKKLSLREIAEKVQLGKSTVSRYLKQAKIQKSSSKAGRPCTISSRLRDVLIRIFLVGKFLNCTDAIKYLKNVVDVSVSKETIRLLLRNAGLKSYKRALKPRLLSIHKKNRRAFARAMKPVDKETWESIVFTDESKYNLYEADGNIKVWRVPGNPTLDHHFRQTVKFGGGSVMV